MTAEDLRSQYKMIDIVDRYGLKPNRAGFLNCPFHSGDHTASLKVYKDSFYCFGCHVHGDIFNFIMMMDNCSFRDAYKILGGESGHLSDSAITKIARRKREAKRYRKRLDDALTGTRIASSEYLYAKQILSEMVPFSDAWCAVQNMLPALEQDAETCLNTYLDVISEGK